MNHIKRPFSHHLTPCQLTAVSPPHTLSAKRPLIPHPTPCQPNGRFPTTHPTSKTAVFSPKMPTDDGMNVGKRPLITHRTDTDKHGWKNGRFSVFVRICVKNGEKTAVFPFFCAIDSVPKTLYHLLMRVDDFIWLPDIIEKLLVKHQVSLDEVEEIFFHKPHFRFVEKGNYPGEDVYLAAGQTEAGRYLTVFFIKKVNHIALIVSARDMDRKERRFYGRQK
jgi:uncharacterized DUF497 family protein